VEDDDIIEIVETIIFNFVEPTNATIADGVVTLNLESEDLPVSAIVAVSNQISEDPEDGQSTELTITIDEPSSYELIVPLTLTGDAKFNVDYTTNFPTEGLQNIEMPKQQDSYQRFDVLDDGRFIFLNGSSLYIYDKTDTSTTNYRVGEIVQYPQEDGTVYEQFQDIYFSYISVDGNTIYLQNGEYLSTIELSVLTTVPAGDWSELGNFNDQTHRFVTLSFMFKTINL